jgi:hypothetical protein
MNPPNIAPNAVNVIGWLLVAASSVILVAGAAGLIYFATSIGAHETFEEITTARERFYWIHPTRHSPWLMVLCIVLSLAIGWIGYSLTDRFVASRLPRDPTMLQR